MSRHGKIAANKTLLVVNIDKEMKAALKALAKKSNRSLSNFVVTELLRAAAAAAESQKKPPKIPRPTKQTAAVGPANRIPLSA